MQKTLAILILMFAVVIVALFVLALETMPPSPRWHHYALVLCFFGSAVCTVFLMRGTNRVGKLFGWLYLLIMMLMGTVETRHLVDLLTRDMTGLR